MTTPLAPAQRYATTAETVTDGVTGLVWQRDVPPGTYTLAQAESYCSGLTLGGSGGWGLPSLRALSSIVDDTQANPAVDPALFPSTPSESFWTSTVGLDGSTQPRSLSFVDGGFVFSSATNAFRVRCVR